MAIQIPSSDDDSKLFYLKTSGHAVYNFNQASESLYRNQPRFPFEYYININLDKVDSAKNYVETFFNTPEWMQIMPLVKTVDMPSMKIETNTLNQYNRMRISQTKMQFDPIKMVFHDVVDGKTLKFWEMYYRYYFSDGNEYGKNVYPYTQNNTSFNTENAENNTVRNIQGESSNAVNSPNNTIGDKSSLQNIVANTLNNHNFGFNLPQVQNVRNLIHTIEIFQVHAGRFNRVTLVNPRISAFTHSTLDYASSDRTVELTFLFEYEYAYYSLHNMQLGGNEQNNGSSNEHYQHGDFLDLPNSVFNAKTVDFLDTGMVDTSSDNTQDTGYNSQLPIWDVASAGQSSSQFAATDPRRLDVQSSSSSLSGFVDISPAPENVQSVPNIQTRPFESTAQRSSTVYSVGGQVVDKQEYDKYSALFDSDDFDNINSGYTMYADIDRAGNNV